MVFHSTILFLSLGLFYWSYVSYLKIVGEDMLLSFLNFLMQMSVPHNESDKVARGGLENMTLVEVGGDLLLNLCALSGTCDNNLTLKTLLYRLVHDSA